MKTYIKETIYKEIEIETPMYIFAQDAEYNLFGRITDNDFVQIYMPVYGGNLEIRKSGTVTDVTTWIGHQTTEAHWNEGVKDLREFLEGII